jgi:DNA transformation protein
MAFKEFLEELYEPMGGVTVRAMFGGLGIFKDALIFGIAFDDALYLRADEATAVRFAAESATQFVYRGMKGREIEMPYYRLPDRLYDEPDEFIAWSEAAFGVAQRAAREKAQRKKPARKAAASTKPRSQAATKKPARRPVRKAR